MFSFEFATCTYTSISKGGSAEWSGKVRVGDRLITVDGNNVSGRTPSELSQIITGPEGSKVSDNQGGILSQYRIHIFFAKYSLHLSLFSKRYAGIVLRIGQVRLGFLRTRRDYMGDQEEVYEVRFITSSPKS